MRVGFASQAQPALVMTNKIARPRVKKVAESPAYLYNSIKDEAIHGISVGNGITDAQLFRWNVKTPLENGVVVHMDAQVRSNCCCFVGVLLVFFLECWCVGVS